MAEDSRCYFLELPKEIRLGIYRLLLLPHDMLSMIPADSETDDWSDVESGDEDGSEFPAVDATAISEDEEGDGDTESDHSTDSGLSGTGKLRAASETTPHTKKAQTTVRKYPAILRTNRQIYDEASSLLYTEGIMVLEPTDLFALARNRHALEFGVASENTWRHHPIKDPGEVQANGTVIYNSAESEEGKMYPHVFSRFQKIHFDASFDFEHTQNVEMWIDDNTHIIKEEDAEDFKQIIRRSSVIKNFVALISKSPIITSLEIVLEVEVWTNSILMIEDMMADDEEDPIESDEKEIEIDRLLDASNERATELFLDSGICESLMEIDNVKRFDFTIGFLRFDEDGAENYAPLPRYKQMLSDIKKAVEANFRANV